MDIIWGTVGQVLSGQVFELNLTHRKDGNKNTYSDIEKIKISETDFGSLPLDVNHFTKELVEENLSGAFVKLLTSRGKPPKLVSSILIFAAINGYLSFVTNRLTLWLWTISYSLYLIHRNIAYKLLQFK